MPIFINASQWQQTVRNATNTQPVGAATLFITVTGNYSHVIGLIATDADRWV